MQRGDYMKFIKNTYLPIINIVVAAGMIILFFCPILISTQAPDPSTRIETIVSPFLHIYSIATVFLLLIPLIILIVIDVLILLMKKRILNWLNLLISLYVFVISICFIFNYEFITLGIVFISIFISLMVISSICNLCIDEYKRRKQLN